MMNEMPSEFTDVSWQEEEVNTEPTQYAHLPYDSEQNSQQTGVK